ncbi:hypothetical protein MANES_11G082501v8 [Manihot esculenta]|uniref:Uncharacterized protein n=1 Tax=Manihot esculenta TaxID=3983 RepID=A0ACB7GW83_MANES|nr:hypothetical protein MANES_11G082501v8 [Manihot esculenta]
MQAQEVLPRVQRVCPVAQIGAQRLQLTVNLLSALLSLAVFFDINYYCNYASYYSFFNLSKGKLCIEVLQHLR